MKTLTTLALTAALAGGALSAQADEQDNQYLEVCKAELQEYYGEGTQFDLITKRQYRDGMRLKVAARLDRDNAYFATCWVTADDVAGYEVDGPHNLLAGTPADVVSN